VHDVTHRAEPYQQKAQPLSSLSVLPPVHQPDQLLPDPIIVAFASLQIPPLAQEQTQLLLGNQNHPVNASQRGHQLGTRPFVQHRRFRFRYHNDNRAPAPGGLLKPARVIGHKRIETACHVHRIRGDGSAP
jgi:hypothetical protein